MYDLIIIGGGPGGLTAGIYAQRAQLNVLLIEKQMLGGQIAVSDVIENYPGFPSISGPDLMAKFEEQARALGLKIEFHEVETITTEGDVQVLKTTDGELRARAVIVATGAKPRPLGVEGEKTLLGKGVSYCATCDGPFFKNQRVVVVGGGDTAVKEAVYLSKIAKEVHIIHRRDKLRAEKILQERALKTENITIHWNHVLKEIKGTKMGVEGVVIEDVQTKAESSLEVEGVFVFVGITPTTGFVDVKKNTSGFIETNQKMETSVPGIFAVGDCRDTPLLQVATAVGDGATAAFIAEAYIDAIENK